MNSAGIARERAGWSWRWGQHLRVWEVWQCVVPSYSLVPAPCASANSRVGPKGNNCCWCSDLLQHMVLVLQHPKCVSCCTRDMLHFQISLQLPDLSSLWLFCSFSVTYVIFSWKPWLLLLSPAFAVLYFFPFSTVLFWGYQHPRRPGFATEKLMQPISYASRGLSAPRSNVALWQYQEASSCWMVPH